MTKQVSISIDGRQLMVPEGMLVVDAAKMAGIEYVAIDENTCLSRFQKELRFNEMYYALAKGF